MSLKLLNAPEDALKTTVEAFRNGCNHVSRRVEGGHRVNTIALIATCYGDLRDTLPSQMAQTVVRTVVGVWRSCKRNGSRGRPPRFRRVVACYQNNRDWSLTGDDRVSIKTLSSRVKLGYQTSPLGREQLLSAKETGGLGGARLVKKRKGWFLDVSVTLPDPPTYEPLTPIGVDLGINILAVARAPHARPLMIRRGRVKHYRTQSHHLRQRLQRKGTPSGRRVLRRISGREKRFVLDQARVAAKRIVEYAARYDRPIIVLEDLEGIRDAKARGKEGRRRLHSWEHRMTQECIRNNAEEHGIPIVFVKPAYSSQACPDCGHTERANRNGPWFHCRACGYQNHADVIGATNVQHRWPGSMPTGPRGPVNGPNGWRNEVNATRLYEAFVTPKPPSSVGGS